MNHFRRLESGRIAPAGRTGRVGRGERRNGAPAAVPALLVVVLGVSLAACEAPPAEARGADDHLHATEIASHHSHADHRAHAGIPGEEHAGHAARRLDGLGADEPSGFSIYHSQSVWTDQHGQERRLESLRGRPQVVAMLYTSCPLACPRIMLDMKRIEGDLPPGQRDDVGFLIVSIDPERDTPEQLASFASGSRLDPDRWTLLTGDEGDILELAALLGVQYRQTGPGEWVHSNLITVLDADGRVVHRQLGLGTDPASTLDVLSDLTE